MSKTEVKRLPELPATRNAFLAVADHLAPGLLGGT